MFPGGSNGSRRVPRRAVAGAALVAMFGAGSTTTDTVARGSALTTETPVVTRTDMSPPSADVRGLRPVEATSETVSAEASRLAMAGFDLTEGMRLPLTNPGAGPLPADPSCSKVAPQRCITVIGARGSPLVLLLGDSHARMLFYALRAAARRQHFTLALATLAGCPWQRGLAFADSDVAECTRIKDIWYRRVIPTLRPTVIVAATRASDHRAGSWYGVRSTDPGLSGTQSQLLITSTKRTVARLVDLGAKVIVIEPLPVSDTVHAVRCLQHAVYADQCDFIADNYVSAAEAAYRGLARVWPGRVADVSIDRLECPKLPRCYAIVRGTTVVRKDFDHLTDRFSGEMWVPFISLLHSTRLF